MASQGGAPGGMRIPPVAGVGSQHGPPLQGRCNQPSPPTFPGIIPRGDVEVSTTLGFSPPREASPQSDGADDVDLEMATAAAIAEWHSILDVFAKFQARLSEDFRPLDPDNSAAVGARASPFGPVRTYRTFSIAGIWMNLYMGFIVLHRVHPTMPPVAMMAAGLKAKETWNYAMEIGRIAAGLSDDVSRATSINTIVASAFIESCFCLFVAGIQVGSTDVAYSCASGQERHDEILTITLMPSGPWIHVIANLVFFFFYFLHLRYSTAKKPNAAGLSAT